MHISIEYESSWKNSFLGGNNNEPIPKKGRKFTASIQGLGNADNCHKRDITLDTVMGILNRLIGDQRKLYQSRKDSNYYFKDLEKVISFKNKPVVKNNEIVYIRNINGSEDKNSFIGSVNVNAQIFTSDYSKELWGILALTPEELYDFIIEESLVVKHIEMNPLTIANKFEESKKYKPLKLPEIESKVISKLKQYFPDKSYVNSKGDLIPSMVYCGALYLQLNWLEKRFNMDSAKTQRGGLPGISKRGFTKKDFMSKFTSGKKKVYGNPYILKQRIKGEGEITHYLIKESGRLEITIDIDREKAREIRNMIENAGVSSFYLGKKGLAYIANDIRV